MTIWHRLVQKVLWQFLTDPKHHRTYREFDIGNMSFQSSKEMSFIGVAKSSLPRDFGLRYTTSFPTSLFTSTFPSNRLRFSICLSLSARIFRISLDFCLIFQP